MAATDRFCLRFSPANAESAQLGPYGENASDFRASCSSIGSVRIAVLTHVVYRLVLRQLSLGASARATANYVLRVIRVPLLQY